MKIALWISLCVCALVMLIGIAMWYLNVPVLIKLILSGLYICTSVIFGGIIIELLLEE